MRAFKPIRKPAHGEWYLVKLEVAVDATHSVYDALKDDIVKKPVRETREVKIRCMVPAHGSPERESRETYRRIAVTYSTDEVKYIAANPLRVLEVELWSDHEAKVAQERKVKQAEGHQHAWPSSSR